MSGSMDATSFLNAGGVAGDILRAGTDPDGNPIAEWGAMTLANLVTHGAANHDDVTRSVYFPAGIFGVLPSATKVNYGDTNREAEALSFPKDGGIYSRCGFSWTLPSDYVAGSQITVYLDWAADTDTDTGHNCRFYVRWLSLADGEAINGAADDALLGLTTPVPVNKGLRKRVTVGSSSAGLVAGETLRITLARAGNEGADTMTGAALVLGMMIEYTANQ